MALNFTTGMDNSEVNEGLNDIKRAFENLYSYIKKKDFGDEFGKQLDDINKEVDATIDSIEKKVDELQRRIDTLRAKQKSALASGNGNEAGALGNTITELVAERTELLKTQKQYQKYKESVVSAAKTAADFTAKQERKHAALTKVGNVLGRGVVGGVKAVTVAVKAFMKIGIVALINAIITALTSFIKYLKSTENGQRALAAATGYLQGVFQTLKSAAMSVGKALFDAFQKIEPVVSALSSRVAGLVSAVAALIKIAGAAIKRDWDSVSKEFQAFKAGMKTVITGEFEEGSAADLAYKQAKAYKELYAQRKKLQQQKEDWSEEKATLEYQIAQAETRRDYATVKRLNDQIQKKDLDFLQKEYDIEKQLVDLKPEDARTVADKDRLRDMRTAILNQKAANVREDAQYDKKDDAAENAAERRKAIEEQLQSELNDLLLSNEQERLNLMEEGTRKEVKQIQHNYEKREEEIRKQEQKWKAENKKAELTGLREDGLTEAQAAALAMARQLNSQTETKELEDIARQNREEYLRQYGDYKEKQLAITEKYDRLIAATDDEYEKKTLSKKFEAEMEELRRKYEASYALIFADASALSDNLLARAIEQTREEAKKAEEEGDIEKLAELYAKLHEQMRVQTERGGDWGFIGIAKAFKKLADATKDAESAIDKTSLDNALEDQQNALTEIERKASQINDLFTQIGNTLEGFGGTLAEIGSGMNSLAGIASDLMDIFAKEEAGQVNRGASFGGLIAGTVNILSMIANSIVNNKKAQDEWNKTIEQSAQRMRMLKLEALDYKQQNLFGVENPYKKAIDGALQYAEAMKELQELQAKLAGGKVQTGTKKAIDWSNVLEGAGVGAAAGAAAGAGIFSGITAGIGAIIGGVIGLIGGALSTKVVPVFEDLTKQYGQLWDEQYNLSDELLAHYDELDEDTKRIVDNWDEIKNKALEAEKAMEDTFVSLSGNLGKDLSSSLIQAFRNGDLDAAISDFHDKVTTSIEDIVEQMAFSAVFSDMFDSLQAEMKDSFGVNGDRNIVDDIMRFERSWTEGLSDYGEQLEEAQEYLRSLGYDVWQSDQRKAQTRSSLGASQDSMDESNARLTTIQSHTYELNENVKRLVAAAGLGGDMTPAFSQPDYSAAISEINAQLMVYGKQVQMLGLVITEIQQDVVGVAGNTQQIADNSDSSLDMSHKIMREMEMVVDSGVKMK